MSWGVELEATGKGHSATDVAGCDRGDVPVKSNRCSGGTGMVMHTESYMDGLDLVDDDHTMSITFFTACQQQVVFGHLDTPLRGCL